ncbi:TonB-linked outer membrane protein, SusC/RagA family [Catalinimonas alkaloidigena]|uniref:TonB-linked outer membrane protein, SusC/RagA family n=1 Tax=Catalinimonas alkaloidigena TaxID=1075417 RepID=A0A1G8YB97_9BACT|nr:TonB-dependent receptor [Catalinimonas alkaloidigena]SDK00179.1 TonB-linked outer membrane protein, SusC/RagA family [Catalinimonas alkaloidigena]
MKNLLRSFTGGVCLSVTLLTPLYSPVAAQSLVLARDAPDRLARPQPLQQEAQEYSLRQVLRLIEQHYDIHLIYQDEIIHQKRAQWPELKGRTVEQALRNVLTPLQLEALPVSTTFFTITPVVAPVSPVQRSQIGQVLPRPAALQIASQVERQAARAARQVTGQVVDATGEGIPGVNILEKGTSNGTITDVEGRFALNVSEDATLVFSAVGYLAQEVAVGTQTDLRLTLQDDIKSLEEVVVVGYGTQKKVNLTGAVASVDSKEIENRPITQASQALSGLVSGVTVAQGSGRPGNDGAAISIRGNGTFSSAGNDPLVLIDGLAASINDIDPNNIKSISVLKDAASASIYGTRAANGVILIETKRGRQGSLQVSYNNYVGWQKVTQLPDFVDSWEYAELRNEANRNEGRAPAYTADEIAKFRNGSDPDNYPNVPHLQNLLTSGSGFQTNHALSFTGGDEQNTYLFSLSYLRQNGVVAENDYDKYNFLLNLDSQIKKNLNLKVNLNGYSMNTDEPRHYDGEMTHMIAFAVRQGPIFAGRKSDGTYGYQDNYSPEAWLASESFVKRKGKFFLGGVELAWNPFRDVTISGKAGYKYYGYTNNSYASDFVFNPNKRVGPSNLSVNSGDNGLLTLQALARYNKQVGQHQINGLLGFSQEAYREDWTTAYRDDFPNNQLYEINAGASSNMQSSGSAAEWGLRSFFGRVNYAYREKYLFEANARYDGTSRFPAQGRWGVFPSFSAGWRLSEEAFVQNALPWIDNLKLRASWGILGNQNIGNYPYQNVLQLGQNYTFGGNLASGTRLTTLANNDITWESTQVTDVGLDVSVLQGKLSLEVDYFDKTTSDILYNISVSRVLGLTPSEVNAGEVKNTGIELVLNYQTALGQVHFGVSPNFSYIKNRVTRLAGSLEQDISKGLFVGQPLNAIYGYIADGLFVSEDEIARYPTQPYAAQPGLVRYKDISGPNGVPDGVVDATYDRTVIGATYPKYAFGATLTADYKGFDLSVILQGLGGFEKQMGSYQAFAFYNGGQIQRWQAENRWTEANPDPNADYIKLTSLNMGAGTIQTSTFWNRDASFLRMKNVQLGYSFSPAVLERLRIDRLRVFFSGQNLLTLHSFYQGWDPEMSQSTGDNSPFYPITGVYTFGLNVRF